MSRKLITLYICIDASMGGSTASLWNLIQSVKENIYPIVLFPREGEGYDFYTKHGIESYIYPFINLCQLKKNSLRDVWPYPWYWHYIQKLRYDYGCLKFVQKILNGRKVDIVHTNTSPNDVGILLSRKLHAKHVWHIRECLDVHAQTNIYGGYNKLFCKVRKADAIISISHFIQEHYHLPPKKTFVINDAIRSRFDTCYETVKEKYVLFSSYELSKEKGTGWAIEAFEKSSLAKEGYKLMLMGNIAKTYKPELIDKIQNSSCTQAIELVPCQKDVRPYFSKAAAYIMASRCEGLGRVTAEAMFFGCPVIARNTGGTPDIVKDGVTGYLFNTIEQAATLLYNVCTSDQSEMILRAQSFVSKNLSQEVYGPQIMRVYNSVLQENK